MRASQNCGASYLGRLVIRGIRLVWHRALRIVLEELCVESVGAKTMALLSSASVGKLDELLHFQPLHSARGMQSEFLSVEKDEAGARHAEEKHAQHDTRMRRCSLVRNPLGLAEQARRVAGHVVCR